MKEIVVEKGADGIIASCSTGIGAPKTASGPDAGTAILKLLALYPEIFPAGLECRVYGKDRVIRIVGHPDRYEIARNGWGDAVMSLIIRFGGEMGVRIRQKRHSTRI
jgi:hypothetical protein